MYGLYDRQGILRFINSDKEACIAYAELFELESTNYCLMNLTENNQTLEDANLITNLDLNQVESNN